MLGQQPVQKYQYYINFISLCNGCCLGNSMCLSLKCHVVFLLLTVVDCGTQSNPVNGQVSHTAGTTFGQMATYSCDLGYNLVGDSNHTCRATGVWSGCAPTCQGMLLLEIGYYLTHVDIARSVVLRCSETGKKSLFFTCATCVPRHYTNCTQSNLEKRKRPSYFCICVEACAGAAQEHAKSQWDDCTGQTHCWWHCICVCFLDYWCM